MKKIITVVICLVVSILVFAQRIYATEFTKEGIQISHAKSQDSPKGHYQGIIETGYAIATGEYGQQNLKFNVINSVRHPNYSIGIGIGLRVFFDHEVTLPDGLSSMGYDVHIPFFLDSRVYLSNKKVSPYLGMGIGCSVGVKAWEVGAGLFSNPSTGVNWKISDRVTFMTGIVYELDRTEFNTIDDMYELTIDKKNAGSLGINIGISF